MGDLHLCDLLPQHISKKIMLESPCCFVPLFHGTDRAIVSMTQEERNDLREACATVIDYLLPIYEENEFEKRTSLENKRDLEELHVKVINARSKASLRKSKNALYSYENVYLTFDPIKANVYAMNASICGELGYIAYWLLRGAKKLEYTLPIPNSEQETALQKLNLAGERRPDPVLVCYVGLHKDRLLTEKGTPIKWETQIDFFFKNFHHGEVRVLGDFDISDGIITSLDEIEKMRYEDGNA